jgi:hypothetical protein
MTGCSPSASMAASQCCGRVMTPGEVVAAIDLAGGEKLARLLGIIAGTHPVFRADP